MDLNDFTNSSEKELSKETFKIEELVKDILSAIIDDTSNENIEITCESFPAITASKLALTIILRNLIENGIKYNNSQRPRIAINGAISNGMAKIKITDNGIGIEEAYFDKVFEMFKRLNSEYKKGSGLGLNISKNLIKRLDGEIKIVKSTLNEGTTFQINFPVEVIDMEAINQNQKDLATI